MNDQRPVDTATWQRLNQHWETLSKAHLRELFADDPQRFSRFSTEACGLFLDYSKHRITAETMELLRGLAGERELGAAVEAMFHGEPINNTEDRAVLHVALRAARDTHIKVDGEDVVPAVHGELERMGRFAERVREGQWKGHSGRAIEVVVNIGIGGSDLGPAMASAALRAYGHPRLRVHFASNLDYELLGTILADVDPETTLFVVESKTFTTQETLTNALSARRWLVDHFGGDEGAVARHFVAVSTNQREVERFGIDADHVFGFWDWVGGRYSVWSAIGLPVMIYVGREAFGEMLEGARYMDSHFRDTPWENNLPVIMGLLGVWYINFFGTATHAVLPYDYALRLLPAYLQQLDMESNGKRVMKNGAPVAWDTGPVVWGAPGNNGQHAFYQLLHQGTRIVPADILVPATGHWGRQDHEHKLLANALAQAEALMHGRTAEEATAEMEAAGAPREHARALAPHRTLPGNQPTSVLLYRRLTPRLLGAIVALYEHKVFVQSVIWGNNAFDQWGVELGKQLAQAILPELGGEPGAGHDGSTTGLIARLRRMRGEAEPPID